MGKVMWCGTVARNYVRVQTVTRNYLGYSGSAGWFLGVELPYLCGGSRHQIYSLCDWTVSPSRIGISIN